MRKKHRGWLANEVKNYAGWTRATGDFDGGNVEALWFGTVVICDENDIILSFEDRNYPWFQYNWDHEDGTYATKVEVRVSYYDLMHRHNRCERKLANKLARMFH